LSLNPDGSFSLNHPYVDDGAYTVTVVVEDGDESGSAALTVNVNNLAPEVGDISGPVDPVQVNTSVSITASFTDSGSADTQTATIDWGDGSTASAGGLTQLAGGGSVAGGHTYSTAGVYTVMLTVTDDDGGVGQAIYQYIVVYDPAGGFVTGSGSIESPAGAYAADPLMAGAARFGFVSKYTKGANVPDGQTRFQFQAAGLRFESIAYDWLVIAGSKAQFKGSGQIDGAGNYGFMLTAVDGDLNGGPDTFRITIWDKDNGDAIVYDNQMGAASDATPTTELQNGSIVVHKPK
jgi:PKD repeat protein